MEKIQEDNSFTLYNPSQYDRLTPETANEIARKLLELDCFKGFQIVTATHIDKDHIQIITSI